MGELRRLEREPEPGGPAVRAAMVGHGAAEVGPAGSVELPPRWERGPAFGEGAQLRLQLRVGPSRRRRPRLLSTRRPTLCDSARGARSSSHLMTLRAQARRRRDFASRH
jgi:hypothetical protein